MNEFNKIMKAKPRFLYDKQCEKDIQPYDIVAIIEINGEPFYGQASLNAEEDEEFFSPKFGQNLAHMRAIQTAFKRKKDEAKARYDVIKESRAKYETISGNLLQNIAYKDFCLWRSNYQTMARKIQEYKQGQERVVSSLKRSRANKIK